MSTWGPGIFDNDSAGDFLSLIVEQMFEVIKKHLTVETVEALGFIELHGDSKVLPAIGIVIALHKQLNMPVGTFYDQDIAEWRRLYLKGWDKGIDHFFSSEDELRVTKRRIIEETFDEFMHIVEKRRKLYRGD
jgi:hypothetical protein